MATSLLSQQLVSTLSSGQTRSAAGSCFYICSCCKMTPSCTTTWKHNNKHCRDDVAHHTGKSSASESLHQSLHQSLHLHLRLHTYMVRRIARQMRVKLTASLEASHSHSSSPHQTPSAPPVASCEYPVPSSQLAGCQGANQRQPHQQQLQQHPHRTS